MGMEDFLVAVEEKVFPKRVLSQDGNVFIMQILFYLANSNCDNSKCILCNLAVVPLKTGFVSFSRRQNKKMQKLHEL